MIRAKPRQLPSYIGFIVCLGSFNAVADIVNDSHYAIAQILYYSPVGQTFTAVDPTIHTISVGIIDFNRNADPQDHDLSLVLLEGTVLVGEPISIVTVTDIPDRHADWLDFVFDPPASVLVGGSYTFQVIDDTPRWGIEYDDGNLYPWGYAWFQGLIAPGSDLRFRVFAEFRPGACCMPDECLQDVDSISCGDVWGGIHAGTGSFCDTGACDRGACCDPLWGECADVLPQQCHSFDWIFTQRNQSCAESDCASFAYGGACCHDATCFGDNYMSRGVCEQGGGVWAGPGTYCDLDTCPPCRFGDIDFDADFDLRDFAALQVCFGRRSASLCVCTDLDGTTYIDLADLALFIARFGGPE